MSAEERWAQRVEWEQEHGDIEIKKRWAISSSWQQPCIVQLCRGIATHGREVGLVSNRGGASFEFCSGHSDDDFALDFYRRMRR